MTATNAASDTKTLPAGGNVSRRTAVRIGTGGLGAVLATRVGRTAAQDMGTPDPLALPAAVQTWIDAYNTRDHAAMVELYTADGVYEDVPNAFVARSEEIPAFLAMGEQGLG